MSRKIARTNEPGSQEAIRFNDATMGFGLHALWDNLTISVNRGEFLAVLGPNGVGKTTLLKIILGLQPLSSGTIEVEGEPPHRGNPHIGYVPQQRKIDAPVRGRDLVQFGLDGHRLGLPFFNRGSLSRVDAAIRNVGVEPFANAPMTTLSGGEQQRLRIAQALVGEPSVLLLDEPLLSLDMASQNTVASLIESRRAAAGTTVVFVTHEINPVLPYVDKVLYLVEGRWAAGSPKQVFTSESLSQLYGIPVEVAEIGDRIVVITAEEGVPSDLMDDEKCRLLSEMKDHRSGAK